MSVKPISSTVYSLFLLIYRLELIFEFPTFWYIFKFWTTPFNINSRYAIEIKYEKKVNKMDFKNADWRATGTLNEYLPS